MQIFCQLFVNETKFTHYPVTPVGGISKQKRTTGPLAKPVINGFGPVAIFFCCHKA